MLRLIPFLTIALASLLSACSSVGGFNESIRPVAKEASYGLFARESKRDDGGAPAATAAPDAEQAKARSAHKDRKIIRSADLSLEVDDMEETGRSIERIARSSGGFVLSSAKNRYQIKVPAAGLDEALEAVAELGEVTRRSLSGQDVTAEYMDIEVRLKNAHAARDSYEALLRKATSVEEMLKVEQALHEVQERIERLEGRRKFLDEHLALSDIDIRLSERRTRGPLQVVWDVITWPFEKLWWL